MRKNSSLIFAVAVFALLNVPCPAHASVVAGEQAPALTARELDGAVFDLAAMKGKVVLVHYWATWCPPCREEMPLLQELYKKYHAEGLEIIGISIDRSRDRDEVETMAKQFSYPIAAIKDVSTNGFGMPSILPISYLIDKQGVVVDVISTADTPVSEASLTKAVKPLLQK